MATIAMDLATAKLNLGLDGMQVLRISQQQQRRHSGGRCDLMTNSDMSS
jgi:hypothetical protein